jgi:type II secretory pathway pseudopilin PulG
LKNSQSTVRKIKTAGWTLVELMVAIGVLAIVTGPIIMLYTFGTRMAAGAHRQTLAAILAQQRIEELIGLPLGVSGSAGTLWEQYQDENLRVQKRSGLSVVLAGDYATGEVPKPIEPYTSFDQQDFMNKLAEVTVQVYFGDSDLLLVEQSVVISLAE